MSIGNQVMRLIALFPYFDYDGNMETKQAISALAAVAQESRLAIFRLLVQAGPAGIAASKIAEQLGIPLPRCRFTSNK